MKTPNFEVAGPALLSALEKLVWACIDTDVEDTDFDTIIAANKAIALARGFTFQVAKWNGNEYVTEGGLQSDDGYEWVNADGSVAAGPGFDDLEILFHGGPRHAEGVA